MKVDTFWIHFKDNHGIGDDQEYDGGKDDDHVFRKHVGDDGLLHSEHFSYHNVPTCNCKPGKMGNMKIECYPQAVINVINVSLANMKIKCCHQAALNVLA